MLWNTYTSPPSSTSSPLAQILIIPIKGHPPYMSQWASSP